MKKVNKKLIQHLIFGLTIYILFSSLDIYFTLGGIHGDISLEGNPFMRLMMGHFGLLIGLVIGKSLVFFLSLIIAIISFVGIERKSNWVYRLALSKMTRDWMKHKRRYIVAFLPIYIVALAQAIAVITWVNLIFFGFQM